MQLAPVVGRPYRQHVNPNRWCIQLSNNAVGNCLADSFNVSPIARLQGGFEPGNEGLQFRRAGQPELLDLIALPVDALLSGTEPIVVVEYQMSLTWFYRMSFC